MVAGVWSPDQHLYACAFAASLSSTLCPRRAGPPFFLDKKRRQKNQGLPKNGYKLLRSPKPAELAPKASLL
jgi:hypothetical protein